MSEARCLAGSAPESARAIRARMRSAWGETEPDLCLRGARVLLGSGELVKRDVAIVGDRIAAVAEDLTVPGASVLDLSGKTLVPGYVEPHTHSLGPLSVGSYCGQALVHGTACVVSDDSFVYGFLKAGQHRRMLDISRRLPLLLRWSLRLDAPRTLPLKALTSLLERPDVAQLGELMTRPALDALDPAVIRLLAAARERGRRIEGHAPGASARTLGASSALGVTADHESRSGAELIERLRAGLWAFIRYTDLLPDAPAVIAELMERGTSFERTAFTTDWSLPPWIARRGIIDAAIRAAIEAGLPPAEAYATATWRPASYLSLDAHIGLIAPGRLASINVLEDLSEPAPLRVFSIGREVAREGRLLVDVPDVDWQALGAPPWSRSPRALSDPEAYRASAADPVLTLRSASMLEAGEGTVAGAGADAGEGKGAGAAPAGSGEPLTCVAIDPANGAFTRARLHGMPAGLEGIASTLTPQRLLVALGAEPQAIARCVEAVDLHGGIAFQQEGKIDCLPLPVGGAITAAPFAEVARFWEASHALFERLGHALPDPVSTLLYMAASSLPGARFTPRGLLDTRSGELIAPARRAA